MRAKRMWPLLAALALWVAPAAAEVSEVKLAAQNGSNYMPLYVMQANKLVEKHLAAKGLAATTVTWAKVGSATAIVDSFLSGAIHFGGNGVPSTALMWDRTRNGIGIKGVSAMTASNIWLMTRKPEIKSLKDFTDKDRIALPSIKSSSQVIFLWMAAEKEFGPTQFTKLDSISVSMAHPDAMASLINGSGEITAHAATSPYAEIEKKAGMHVVTDEYTAHGGPVTGLNFCSSEQFRKANPVTYDAVVAAFTEAIEWINADKARAAKLYLDISKEKMSLEEMTQIFMQPDYIFGPAPRGVGKALDLMHKAGAIKTKAASWKDLYFPEAGSLTGD